MNSTLRLLARLTSAFLGLFAGLFGCGGRTAVYMGPPPRLPGRALDKANGKPIAGLRVELLRDDRLLLRSATRSDGVFFLPQSVTASEARYTIRITDVDGPANGSYRGLTNTLPGTRLPGKFHLERKADGE